MENNWKEKFTDQFWVATQGRNDLRIKAIEKEVIENLINDIPNWLGMGYELKPQLRAKWLK